MTKRLHALRSLYPNRLSIRFRHFPLDNIHAFATEAAIAAECAGEQERFESFHDNLFARQDSLGVKSWAAYAKLAGVPDTVTFNECRRSGKTLREVKADRAAGNALHLTGTPTLVINGTLYRTVPDTIELEHLVAAHR